MTGVRACSADDGQANGGEWVVGVTGAGGVVNSSRGAFFVHDVRRAQGKWK